MKSGFGSIQNTITNIFFLVLFTSCTENKEQIQNRKTVDSLSGVLSTVISVSSKTDSVQLNKALLKFNNYNQFVKRIVKDTFSKGKLLYKKIDTLYVIILYSKSTQVSSCIVRDTKEYIVIMSYILEAESPQLILQRFFCWTNPQHL